MRQAGLACLSDVSISSITSLLWPYGLVCERGKSSVMGTVAGSPYTVALLENTSVGRCGTLPSA